MQPLCPRRYPLNLIFLDCLRNILLEVVRSTAAAAVDSTCPVGVAVGHNSRLGEALAGMVLADIAPEHRNRAAEALDSHNILERPEDPVGTANRLDRRCMQVEEPEVAHRLAGGPLEGRTFAATFSRESVVYDSRMCRQECVVRGGRRWEFSD